MFTNLKKLLLSFLCISMIITMIQPRIIYANESSNDYIDDIIIDDSESTNTPTIKYEDFTLREESSRPILITRKGS